MMKIWDYFMRRKTLMVVFLVLFIVGGVFSYQALYGRVEERAVEYIRLTKWPQAEPIEVPRTGEDEMVSILGVEEDGTEPINALKAREDDVESTVLAVLSPDEVVMLEKSVEIPRTGGEEVLVKVMSPEEVVMLAKVDGVEVPRTGEEDEAEGEVVQGVLGAESIEGQTESAETYIVPGTEAEVTWQKVGYFAFLGIAGLGIAILGIYLVEQHFRR